jgi:hypothetical protein
MRDKKGRPVPVILYSTSLHRWEVWYKGSPVAHGSLEACREAYPKAPEPSEMQYRLAANDPAHR